MGRSHQCTSDGVAGEAPEVGTDRDPSRVPIIGGGAFAQEPPRPLPNLEPRTFVPLTRGVDLESEDDGPEKDVIESEVPLPVFSRKGAATEAALRRGLTGKGGDFWVPRSRISCPLQ